MFHVKGEPDSEEFLSHGLQVKIKRMEHGHLCGYVGVQHGHPAYGEDYEELPDIDVHGRLTFSGTLSDDGTWYLGFDCAHAGDRIPGISDSGTYRDISFVRTQCESLARQLATMPKTP